MKWVFIDYENIGSMEKIDLSQYEKVIVFLGAKQPKLDFGTSKYEAPINLTVIQIKDTRPNNLDFHLAYYLGKYDHEAGKDVTFEVVTNDNGFAPLISHLQSNGRSCKHINNFITQDSTQKLLTVLKKSPKEKRPKTLASLKNHIAVCLKLQNNEIAVQGQVNKLVQEKKVILNGESVEYQC
ncbi:PIN domain-containing protein [Microbulbifer variabilis]|uniref:PIN domain-containing protein n=1 Tax=Microbulbifer variabilis TaxID=266805 RepID=UPI001CFF35D0|nr:PIN domain-containing protein [Microbulbifer variabilis]